LRCTTMPKPKKAVVPRLRFPEFREAGEWEVRAIEDIAEKLAQGGTPDTTVPEYWNGEVPWITPAEMGDDALHHYTERTVRSLSKRGLQNSSAELLPAHSVIISSRAPIGYVTINRVSMATNQGCKGIVLKQNIYHEFLYYSLLRARRRLNDLGAGAGFKEISSSSLKTFKIPLPQRHEQQKIADCLSSLDEVIVLEALRLDALNAHKKSLLQQLFPREGETTPRLRFPEFRNAGPWEVKRLGELFDERNERGGEGLELLSVTISDGVVRASDLERKTNASTNLSNYKRVSPGDIVYNSMRMWQGASGVSRWHGIVSPAYTVVIPIETQDAVFWSYHFKLSHSIEKFARSSQGVTSDTWNLKYPAFSAIKMAFPADPEEQQKIADCLSSLDELIELEALRLDALRAHKKGLLQQLFPQEVE